MTKKARGIEPCLAYESWSSVEESADPLQHSLKSEGKILLFDRAGQSGVAAAGLFSQRPGSLGSQQVRVN